MKTMPKAAGTIVEDVVSQLIGEDVLPLVKALKNKQNISEFKLASTIRREINMTRNMLYRLYDQNLVSFSRKKDKKKGWYIYYWTFNIKRIKYLAEELKKKRLEKLQERLGREQTTQFFSCKNNCIRLSFEQATDFEYKCPECGELLNQEDNSKKIEDIKTEIASLQNELAAKPVKETKVKQPKPAKAKPKAKGKRAKSRR
ncbi:hypothetical protein HY492_03995 [Candidatus Woesearchaeota archaeon]|nr:hypothetical protein [Candidatus Woesearchaeota archaeon]